MSDVPKLHDDEVDIDASLVTSLLAEQFPRWSGLPVRVVRSSGTDNVTFRVGSDLAVRMPRAASFQGQVERDLTWLPRLAPHLPLAVPEPLAVGAPGAGYPFTWGIYRWLEGEAYDHDRLADPVATARELAAFVQSLQAIDPTGAPTPADDPFTRGTPLAPRDQLVRAALDELRDEFDTGLVLAAWERSLAAGWDGVPRWIHGDLMPGNALTIDGRLSAIIDWSCASVADPAGDLLAAWYLFEGASRQAFRDALEVDEDTWARARGWVLSLELIAIPYYRTRNPAAVDEHETIDATLADFVAEAS